MLSHRQKYKLALRNVKRNKPINTFDNEEIPKNKNNCLQISNFFLPREEVNSPIFKRKSVTFEREVKVRLVIKSKKSEDLWWDDEEIDNELKSFTRLMRELKVFGVPTFIYKKQRFWGQDRVNYLKNIID